MAFRTNKVPAIEERTVSGSSVSFNSAFALPLKACKVSFSATQAGSGDPSPSNPRAISGVSSIGLTANSTPVSVSLGEEQFGGYVDLVRKKLVLTYYRDVFNLDDNIGNVDTLGSYKRRAYTLTKEPVNNATQLCNYAPYNNSYSAQTTHFYCSLIGSAYRFYLILPDTVTELSNIEVVYPLATPIEIDLSSIPDLTSAVGNNTFSTDTGTLEITFADLQEKSASGAVASFNTALAMPLSSCNISVNAWQEGSGDPSPDNVRPIHGFSEVNVNANAVVHTIQLGQEVYGAEVDLVSGIMTVEWDIKTVQNQRVNIGNPSYIKSDACDGFIIDTSIKISASLYPTVKSDYLRKADWGAQIWAKVGYPNYFMLNNQQIHFNIANDLIGVTDYTTETIDSVRTKLSNYLQNNPLNVLIPLDEPFTVQLTPAQIATIIGNNTIFADTGDVDLTYKDLDIAKRGNFREVFKLPS